MNFIKKIISINTYAIDYRLYRKYGYEHCYDQLEYNINIEDLKNFNLLGRLYRQVRKI